jgi:putative ABC transport system permease protein
MPAVKATATPPIIAMKAGSRGVTARRERFGIRRALVVAQVAMSLVLLVGAFLFVRSFEKLANLDAGFRQSGILNTYLDFSQVNVPLAQRNQYKQQLVEQLQGIPGVEAAGGARLVPLGGDFWNDTVHTDASGQDVREVANFNRVLPGFFRTLEIPLIKGRDVGAQDTLGSPAVAIVNESFVRRFLKGKEPLGTTFRVDEGAGVPESVYQVIGIVGDTKYDDMRDDFGPIAYLATQQDKRPDSNALVALRSSLSLDDLTASIEHSLAQTDPAIRIQFSVFKTQIRDTLQRDRLMASLSGFFGFLAGLLATIGLYGVMSYMVVRRRNEIGIRMALGADRGRVLGLIMREAVFLLAAGLAVGAGLSLATTRVASTLLFGLKPNDPLTLVLAAGTLSAVAVAASYLPAFRAARIHPLEALREE